MGPDDRILGTVTDRWRISLIEAVRHEYDAGGEPVEIGDRLVFRRRGDEVVLEPA